MDCVKKQEGRRERGWTGRGTDDRRCWLSEKLKSESPIITYYCEKIEVEGEGKGCSGFRVL